MKYPHLMLFCLNSILSDIRIITSVLSLLASTWYIFAHPLFSPFESISICLREILFSSIESGFILCATVKMVLIGKLSSFALLIRLTYWSQLCHITWHYNNCMYYVIYIVFLYIVSLV